MARAPKTPDETPDEAEEVIGYIEPIEIVVVVYLLNMAFS